MNTRTFEDYCRALEGAGQREKEAPVSYNHLTLPTILLV